MGDEREGIIQYIDGWCYGISAKGKLVCLGSEVAIKEMLASPTKRSINPLVNDIIDLERELIKENETDGREVKRPGNIRSGLIRGSKHREANPRRTSPRKRVAFYKT